MSEFTVKTPPSFYDYGPDDLPACSEDSIPQDTGKYARYYSDESFWRKIEKYGRMAGGKAAYYALLLWYVATKPSTPLPVKALIFGGLGYFVLPIDTVPDFLVGIGYADDVAILVGIISAYGMYMDDASKARARAKTQELFGQDIVV
jgi:uncharacterized membrane protein YkvA (DUF1232 family)